MNPFRKMQERLKEEGWYVGWNEPCCQSCAWSCLPMYLDEEQKVDVDYSKVLFNHSQDCEVDMYEDGMECETCDGEGYIYEEDLNEDQGEDDDDTCPDCDGSGYNTTLLECEFDDAELDRSVEGFLCLTPESQTSSYFCFDGSKEGVENFKAIIPIIEECGVTIDHFDDSGKSRIELSWRT